MICTSCQGADCACSGQHPGTPEEELVYSPHAPPLLCNDLSMLVGAWSDGHKVKCLFLHDGIQHVVPPSHIVHKNLSEVVGIAHLRCVQRRLPRFSPHGPSSVFAWPHHGWVFEVGEYGVLCTSSIAR